MKQKGFAPILILIVLAALIVIGALAYGYFITAKKEAPESAINSSGGTNPFEITSETNPKDCLDTDYTGCDTSADFMTWKDDGVRNPPNSSNSTIFSK